ncbi:hypothetical protein [Aeromonas caviae]|uniref:hypothetical protein n=1 Tax=Aeromonas caviae TaxID=648 RepID=UPI0029D66924|nr:hypothetical protein [Aeromonas caviae]MDX7711769.1 hypothetical protein [Aeromonas caviae]
MNALDQALAELEADIDAAVPPAAAVAEEVIEVVAEVTTEASVPPVDELADLEAILGMDATAAAPAAATAPSAEVPAVDTVNSDLDALEELLGEAEVSSPDAVTLEAVEQELSLAETREELYAETSPDAAGAVDLTAEAAKAPAKSDAPVKMKSRAHGASKPSAALVARLGSVEAVETHLRIDAGDSSLSAKELTELLKERMAELDTLPKKVGEKAVNLIAHLAGGAKLSCYTEIALGMLLETGELSSKALYDRYKARPYSEGTSRSQCGQLMQLLPAMGIAERPTTGSLTLVKDSPMANALREAMKSAA